ncbi:hypothetical protein Scep_011767 [Stephania cephalantha]|uniref:DSBA-like thioredoxin domain-containing protein n=1 Tax=Stephania cephalantha TaxID=152367 RepID=A0AAP0JDY3_9MAGN
MRSLSLLTSLSIIPSRNTRFMAQSASNTDGKKLIKIDISSDTVCPWCFVGKKNLDKAIASAKDQFDFKIQWHPYLLNPSAPKEGIPKREFYEKKFGSQSVEMAARMTEVYRRLGLEYNMSGLTGNTLDSHRLITWAAHHGLDKQNALVEELFVGYFTQGKYIGDRQVTVLDIIFIMKFLAEAAAKVGLEGAEEFLEDPNKGVAEVNEELAKYSTCINGVPHFVINGEIKISGGQPPEVFLRAFQAAANNAN